MPTTLVPTLPELAYGIIRKLTPYTLPEEQWKLTAAAYAEPLLWLKVEARCGVEQVMLGIPSSVAADVLERIDENAIRDAWNEPGANLLELELLSQRVPAGNRKLLIAPVPTPYFGEIRVSVLY